ncbi:glyoxylase-like metal-dependent hydrolase (beta-lactamase superfamily II) [Rhodococcus opacus]|nr:glyoxylase-like metal-dependent hydrolase (beta-lactamase superfamily II) [Rhodococcus opacus]
MAGENWFDEGAVWLDESTFRIPLPLDDSLKAVNCYGLIADDEIVLIDPGEAGAETRSALSNGLNSLGYSVDNVGRVLVTHAHRDHATSAFTLRDKWSFQVAIGEGERDSIEALQLRRPSDPIRQVALLHKAGAADIADALPRIDPHFDSAEWQRPDSYLADGEAVKVGSRCLVTLHTPGHTRGHVIFHDTERNRLFSGDHILPLITPSLAFEQVPLVNPLRSFLASLDIVLQLPDAELLPAHGPTGGSSHERAQELIDHHENRLDACAQLVPDAGESDGYTIARELLWTRRERKLDELDTFGQTLAVLETVAHLELLETRRVLTSRVTGDGLQFFRMGA